MRNSEAYERFMENLIGDNHNFEIVALANGMVNQCVNLGFNHGMSEIETLRCAILALVKVSDEDLQCKMIEMLKNPSPSFGSLKTTNKQ